MEVASLPTIGKKSHQTDLVLAGIDHVGWDRYPSAPSPFLRRDGGRFAEFGSLGLE